MTFTSRELRDQIVTATDASEGEYDIDAITEEIIEKHGAVDVDTLESDEFWAIVSKHATDEETTGFTAWLTTQADMTLNGEHCEVNVIEDEPVGGPEPMPTVQLPIPATVNSDDEAAQDAAEDQLTKAGWETVGEWEQYDHGYTIAVRRA